MQHRMATLVGGNIELRLFKNFCFRVQLIGFFPCRKHREEACPIGLSILRDLHSAALKFKAQYCKADFWALHSALKSKYAKY